MPPKRVQHDDSATPKEKGSASGTPGGRGRRNNATGTNATVGGSHLKEVMSSTGDNASTHSGQMEQVAPSIPWTAQDRALLQGYRRAYRLDTPSSFKHPLSPVVLGSGIGKYSPTMARPVAKRRVPKEQLALVVRKNFNAASVNESDVIVDLLYKVKTQDKGFRARFAPKK